jgi:hypothetical protein
MMKNLSHAVLALSLLLLGNFARAQTAGTITFTANQTSATGSLTPVLTWSTSPVASGCTASGDWSGSKFASGSETLATITSNKSYTLTCTWAGGTATVSWTAPTTNTNGTALTNLAGFKVLFGNSASNLNQSKMVNDPRATSTTVSALGAGTWYFAVRAVNTAQLESDNSNVAQKTIASASAARTVAITVNPAPPPPPPPSTSLKTTGTRVYDVLWQNGTRVLGQQVGTIARGKPCDSTYKVGTDRYRVNRNDVSFSAPSRSNSVVARCAIS